MRRLRLAGGPIESQDHALPGLRAKRLHGDGRAAGRHREEGVLGREPLHRLDGLPKQGQRFVKEGALAATIIKPVTAGLGVQCAARAVRGVLSTQDVVLVPQPYPEFQPQ